MRAYSLITLLLIVLTTSAYTESRVEFFEGSLITAKEKAKSESRMYFVEFYAKWCKPCQWMEKNTYTDKNLAKYIKANYLAVRVDIDDFDGFAWKQKYNIEFLPTILVFNSEGRMLGKYEKSLSANKLLKILKEHQADTPDKPAISEPRPQFVKHSSQTNQSGQRPVQTGPKQMNPVSTNTTGNTEYRIQVGIYSVADNVFRQVEELKSRFEYPVKVFNHKNVESGKILYRVTIGKFSFREDALALLTDLKRKGYEGFVKDTSEL